MGVHDFAVLVHVAVTARESVGVNVVVVAVLVIVFVGVRHHHVPMVVHMRGAQ